MDDHQSDDAPKLDPEREDALGFAPFAKRLAASLYGVEAPNGYVVGLEGPWGSGKSTAINFTKHYLAELNQAGSASYMVEVIDFRPWLISGRDDLISAFFKVLTETLEPRRSGRRSILQRVFRSLKASSDPLFNAAAVVGAAAAGPGGAAGVKAASTVASKTFQLALDRWLETPSLQVSLAKLAAKLRTSTRRFLVVIDDIDRLQPAEMLTVMQLVKSIGSLPNVVYLLAYDRSIVWSSLPGGDEPTYAEKIIQHQVALPPPTRIRLLKLLDSEIRFLTSDVPSTNRWSEIVRNGIYEWITSVRDVNRLANALRFAAPALKSEIDSQDLIAMEGLRLFNEPLYNWIKRHRDYLMRDGRYQFDFGQGSASDAISSFKAVVGGDAASIELMAVLFPARARELAGEEARRFSSIETYPSMRARRGVATVEGYEAYFGLSPPSDVITKSDVDHLFAHLDDEGLVSAMLDDELRKGDLQKDYRISEFLNEVCYRFIADRRLIPTTALFSALIKSGERIYAVKRLNEDVVRGPWLAFTVLIDTLLDRWGVQVASERALNVLTEETSTLVLSDFYVRRGKELGILPTSEREPPRIDVATLTLLGERTIAAITASSSSGVLASAPTDWQILDAWRHLAPPEIANSWLREVAEVSAVNFAKISLGYLGYSTTPTGRFYSTSMRAEGDPAFSLVDVQRLAAKHLNDPALSTDERDRLVALITSGDGADA